MASDDVEVHYRQMAAHGAAIRSAAAEAQRQNDSVQQELASCGNPFGSDLVGSLLGACYQAIASAAMSAYTSNAAALDGHGARVQAMAASWEQAEQANTANAASVGKSLG